MKSKYFERLNPESRRRFLKAMGIAVAAPMVPELVRRAAAEMCGEAHAEGPPSAKYLIEINLRDQWDHAHLFVAPSLARKTDLRRGEQGSMTYMFYSPAELQEHPNNVYLTPESLDLAPHVDTIAQIDCCEIARGAIHGHEAANPMRSPGRDYAGGPGRGEMWLNDPIDNFPQGCEAHRSSSPTPAAFFSYYNKALFPDSRIGIAFKGISRGIHTSYHYGAGLANAELDRFQNRDLLFQAFPERIEDVNVFKTEDEANAFAEILRAIDPKFLQRRKYGDGIITTHDVTIEEARKRLWTANPKVVKLPLTEEEVAYWSEGVPKHSSSSVKAQIWEQMAWAFKLVESDQVRSVALEFDFVDVHPSDDGGRRKKSVIDVETKQCAKTLARLIQKLKDAQLYDKTVIAIFSTDGGREAKADSYGNGKAKNPVVLAGGMIRGGYYGDVQVVGNVGSGHEFAYVPPRVDDGGLGTPDTGTGGRLKGGHVWRTIMKALAVPDTELQFPDVVNTAPLNWLLR